MKKDPKVREFQRSALMSLIYTIGMKRYYFVNNFCWFKYHLISIMLESMTEMDYLVDVPVETYEELFDERSKNQETMLKTNFR